MSIDSKIQYKYMPIWFDSIHYRRVAQIKTFFIEIRTIEDVLFDYLIPLICECTARLRSIFSLGLEYVVVKWLAVNVGN